MFYLFQSPSSYLIQSFYFQQGSFETAISNPRLETSKVELKIAASTRSIVTSNKILKRVAMKNIMHYSKQTTTDSTSVKFAAYSDYVILAMRTQRFNFFFQGKNKNKGYWGYCRFKSITFRRRYSRPRRIYTLLI